MYTLGINAAFHDSSAALLRDDQPIAAAEEERFTRIKHAKRPVPFTAYQLPFHAIDYCLRQAGIGLRRVETIAYSFDPGLLLAGRDPDSVQLPLEPSRAAGRSGAEAWEPLLLAGVINAPRFLVGDVPHHLQRLRQGIRSVEDLPAFEFVDHHLAHAASAYFVSGFPEAAVLTLDGRGECATTVHALAHGASIDKIREVQLPHSLGLLYEDVTDYLGFLRSSDEYKVMALASFGDETLVPRFQRFVELTEDGGYRVSLPDLESAFGPRRLRGEPIEQRHLNIASALQRLLEESVLGLVSWLHAQAGVPDLCLAGGVALNCVMNARVRDESAFRRVFVQPAAGDAGTALGAAYIVDARKRGQPSQFTMTHAFLGPEYETTRIQEALDRAKLAYYRSPDIADDTAALISAGRIVGWFQGRMEFGPRALGARSIVASPTDPNMKNRLNAIKDREDFRPVAPAVLAEDAADFFEPSGASPFMLFTSMLRPERADAIPAACHSDGTARIQTVSSGDAPLFHELIAAFKRRTGIPVIVNTSFNTQGRPIVCTPEDALECFYTSPLDALAIGPFLLRKPGI